MSKIYRLSEKPLCFQETVELIEKSFHYKKPNSFEIDFAPLISKNNHHNCFILLDEEEKVIAHIGVKEKFLNINNQKFSFCMLGGIAVNESKRGEGHFQNLLQYVMAEKRDETSFFLLWSDKEKLYNKFGFHLCGYQYEFSLTKTRSTFEKTLFKNLNYEEKESVKDLYQNSFSKIYLASQRNDEDWQLITNMTSADLYLRRANNKITDYYFINKGQDLPEIIYEYGTNSELLSFLKEISHYGKVWMGFPFLETESIQYQFMMSPGNLRDFASFIRSYTSEKFTIRNINLMKQEVFFDFNEETLVLPMEEFLRGVFGPGIFEELGSLKSLFISGIDSI